MSNRWKCEACGAMVLPTQKGNHVHWQCPEQGEGRKKREAAERKAAGLDPEPQRTFFQHLPCMCGCGAQVGQIKGQKKRYFVDDDHYDKWRSPTKVAQARRAREEPAELEKEEADLAKRKFAEEMAPVVADAELTAKLAELVPMVTGEASHALWGACLGVAL